MHTLASWLKPAIGDAKTISNFGTKNDHISQSYMREISITRFPPICSIPFLIPLLVSPLSCNSFCMSVQLDGQMRKIRAGTARVMITITNHTK